MRHLRLSRLTFRTRLTLVYGGLFLIAGVVLLGLTYALVAQRPPRDTSINRLPDTPSGTAQPPTTAPTQVPGDAPVMSEEPAVDWVVADTWRDALQELLTQGGIALGAVGVAATVLCWLLAGRLLRPLQRITDMARRIADAPAADRGLRERIALTGPVDEVKRLADTFDVMLERLDHVFDGQRRFIANASHELRTPLALNRALLDVAMSSPPVSPQVRELGTTLLEVNARHERLIDGLLLLARSEREVSDRSFVDLADIVEHVLDRTTSDPVTVHAEPGEAETTGSSVLLERLVQNLVDNGVRHNIGAHGWMRVSTRTRPDGWIELRVSNTGPVVTRDQVQDLFEPFRRLAADRTTVSPATVAAAADTAATPPGAGLGLSIVRAIATAHGGQVRAVPRAGGGLVVTVVLRGPRDGSAGTAEVTRGWGETGGRGAPGVE